MHVVVQYYHLIEDLLYWGNRATFWHLHIHEHVQKRPLKLPTNMLVWEATPNARKECNFMHVDAINSNQR